MGVSDGRLRHATAGLAWKLVCCVELQEMVSWRHRGNLSILAKPHPARALRYAGGFLPLRRVPRRSATCGLLAGTDSTGHGGLGPLSRPNVLSHPGFPKSVGGSP